MTTCGQFRERIQEFYDTGMIDIETSRHLEGCEECSLFLDWLRNLDKAMKAASEEMGSISLPEPGFLMKGKTRLIPPRMAAAAVTIVVLVAGSLLVREKDGFFSEPDSTPMFSSEKPVVPDQYSVSQAELGEPAPPVEEDRDVSDISEVDLRRRSFMRDQEVPKKETVFESKSAEKTRDREGLKTKKVSSVEERKSPLPVENRLSSTRGYSVPAAAMSEAESTGGFAERSVSDRVFDWGTFRAATVTDGRWKIRTPRGTIELVLRSSRTGGLFVKVTREKKTVVERNFRRVPEEIFTRTGEEMKWGSLVFRFSAEKEQITVWGKEGESGEIK